MHHSQAQALYEESLALLYALGGKGFIVEALVELAALATATGGFERAVRLAGAADVLFTDSGYRAGIDGAQAI